MGRVLGTRSGTATVIPRCTIRRRCGTAVQRSGAAGQLPVPHPLFRAVAAADLDIDGLQRRRVRMESGGERSSLLEHEPMHELHGARPTGMEKRWSESMNSIPRRPGHAWSVANRGVERLSTMRSHMVDLPETGFNIILSSRFTCESAVVQRGILEVCSVHEGQGCHSIARGGRLVPSAHSWQPQTIQTSGEAWIGNGGWTCR